MSVEIVKVKLSEIHELEHNPRQITKKDFDILKKSLKEFPEMLEVREIVVDENGVILGGNQRYKALLADGETETIVKRVSGWSDKKKREFAIKDNIANGDWDMDELANTWGDLPLGDWGLEVPRHIDIHEVEPADIDNENTYSVSGNIYRLGEHRVFCGSFEDDAMLDELFGDRKAVCTFTDPPYNIAYKSRDGKSIKNDDMSDEDFELFLNRAFECVARHMQVGGGRD